MHVTQYPYSGCQWWMLYTPIQNRNSDCTGVSVGHANTHRYGKNYFLYWWYCNGGRFDRQFHPMSGFFPSQFSPKKCDILQVYFWPDFWSLTVFSESHKSAIVACVLVRWHSWTWFVYVVGPIRLVSWPAWRASSGAVSPQTQAHRACQLNR